ncbi:putative pentatricopeptide repeat-containing protein At3g49142 [Macadamia integrifolia]|uniref:putative pentatricopeptide repeat-containing protein At3g49142 n=1 Tax=Macadamia integrifolia TaxID=60698 RepID=UPI001C4E2FCA|nr:putative pentatricopeptide repeat-containing protein At3g49142 [Macadamia integrifolia]XP_042504455.1 putative pentatricopeptide repeat-containing protein At3g49142 [Macadamia integrifolia]XP_042504456.1 putative pentatricopeptide repeat-containing protein At3g49142 [Macadamia integrifolia]
MRVVLVLNQTSLSRHFVTAKHFENLISSIRKPSLLQLNAAQAIEENVFGRILDRYPDIPELKKLHSKIFVNGHLCSNPSLGIKLMRAYAARGKPIITRQIFDEIRDKNVVFFNVMIRSYVNNNLHQDSLLVYMSMLVHGVLPDNYTIPCVLKACSGSENLRVGWQIHASVVKLGLDSNLFVGNGLVFLYGKCNYLVDARRILDRMHNRDVVSWNSMVAGYAQNGRFDEALEVCKEMELQGLKPDAGTMASLSPAVTHTSTANVSFVEEMFNQMPKKGLVSWNVMIAIYVNNSMPAKAVELFRQMEANDVEPDAVTIASVLPACGDLSALMQGRKIHEYVVTKRLCPNMFLENALVDMYANCGCLQDARQVFDGMQRRDVVSWTSMISAYGMNGQGQHAVALFSKMQDSGLSPDQIAFVSVLSACSHSGLLDEGRFYFKLMTEKYMMVPRIEHYACMVDLLGRAGQVDEAYGFIKQMPTEPNERVWGALLSACRVYSNTNLGLVAADHLFQLVPEQAGYYVLLSNIYAKAGRWNDVATVRSLMKNKGIKKLPGCSNVELDDRVHTFLVGDHSHPQSKEIYAELDVLLGKMKELGYVPETVSALHDVEEEDKEGHLVVHSEKLAIVFAIINTKPGTPIRITKNLRVCADCHIAAKLISKISECDIIVRDTNRFHHFESGICSCGDYW